jgi:hypothetical protein
VLEDEDEEQEQEQEQGVRVESEEGGSSPSSSSLTGSLTPATTNLNLERVANRRSHQLS